MKEKILILAALALPVLLSCEKRAEVTLLAAKTESELREKLAIPPEAKRVIVFGQNAHMDLDWQLTFPEYYDRYVEKIIGQTLDILDENPRYFYSMAEMAFLKYHLEKHPEDRERLKRHTKTGRFRIVGGGITSPDVVLPTGEALLRDFMYGRRFTLEEFGVGSVSAWLPDDFGLGSGLPSLLTAAGYKYAALSRADGVDNFLMPNMKYTPRPGSTAEKLLNEKAIDFWWKGADGTRILTHWMPYMYCQGDNIDYDEPFQLPGGHLGPFKPDADSTNGKIAMYVSQLADVSPTDYMFVPVGCDFAMPKPRLVEYMDHWNEMKYPETGVWAVAATFEEFARLVEFQGKRVPELEVDIAPYWMGFFGSRVELKKLHREASYLLMQAEKFATLESLYDPAGYPKAELRDLWEKLAWSNHHDYLPGTSPDRVYKEEQLPILRQVVLGANELLSRSIQALTGRIYTQGIAGIPIAVWNPLSHTRDGLSEIRVSFPNQRVRDIAGIANLSEGEPVMWQRLGEVRNSDGTLQSKQVLARVTRVPAMAFALLEVGTEESRSPVRPIDSAQEIGSERFSTFRPNSAQDSLDSMRFSVLLNRDDGGMWRMGHEMDGCTYQPVAESQDSPNGPEDLGSIPLFIRTRTSFNLSDTQGYREKSYSSMEGRMRYTVHVAAPIESTVTGRLETGLSVQRLVTSTPYAWADRPLRRHYNPTFWPVLEWVDVSQSDGRGFLFVSHASQGWHVEENGAVEMMITRNASLEKCQVLGAIGTDPEPHEVSFWVIPHEKEIDAAQAYRWALEVHQPLFAVTADAHDGLLSVEKNGRKVKKIIPFIRRSFIEVGGADLMALKRTEGGDGLVLRLFNPLGTPVEAKIKSSLQEFGFKQVYESDAMEEPFRRLPDLTDEYTVKMDRHLRTLLIR